tara:strand:+ start:793 stop:1710 length:918 start_codon:yes stop_codon:yes gene_type:complete
MAVNVGQSIGEAEYTTLRTGINLVMGTPTGTGTAAAGYNLATSAPARGPADKIQAADWNALKTDADKAYVHQTGNAISPALATVNTDSSITKVIHDALETAINFVKTDGQRFNLAAGQSTTTSARSKNKTNWNGTQIHDVTFTWGSSNAAKAFFNAGGRIRIATTLSYSGSEAKTLDWQTMVADTSVIAINYVSAFKESGTGGTISADDGYYDINGTERELYTRGGASPYSENRYKVLARSITNGLRIRVLYEDNDTGDQTGSGAAVDENVQGTLTSALSFVRATGTNVEVTAPTISTGNTNTFT